ncbi:Asp/Glu/hydantoin racemase [Phanerochaete sordida]|uniref:Asp/Glu/hydantoin racemase n=1 Tax=Phanerochaete sordida TaxID=48140 RepID=A0A9P3GNI0_9APHY|nr:Asp/Glu/hydantoin racemase [Phanerochaete sordida]
MASKVSILVINPNSTASMTDALKPLLHDLLHPGLHIDFYTAPATAPKSINDEATSDASTRETLPDLLDFVKDKGYAAYLVACYSSHPLTPFLRQHLGTPVLNIFEASVIRARSLSLPFGIVTTGRYWEGALSAGIAQVTFNAAGGHAAGVESNEHFVGVRSTGLSAAELHSTPREEVDRRIMAASAALVRDGAQVVLLGCAGMSGMEEAVVAGARGEGQDVRIVDGVRAGVELLDAWVRAGTI